MRKSFIVLLTMLVLAAGTVYYAQTGILQEKDKVQFTEQILYGDKAVAEGITVEMENCYNEQLFWNSAYVIGETPSVTTKYEFFPWSESRYRYSREGAIHFTRNTDLYFSGVWENLSNQSVGLEKAWKELYDSVKPGEEEEMMIYLQDYMEYYHFGIEFHAAFDGSKDEERISLYYNEKSLLEDIETAEQRGAKEEAEKLQEQLEDVKAFQEFFKIPVLDNEVAKLALAKDEKGNVIAWGEASLNGGSASGAIDIPDFSDWEKYDGFSFMTMSAFKDNDCYMTFEPYTRTGKLVDMSQIPGGYGIYHFTYDGRNLHTDTLKMVYPLDVSTEIYDMTLDKSGKNLLLFTVEGSQIYMSIIDVETMELVDKIVVSTRDYGISSYKMYEDFMVINGEQLLVFTIDENGSYHKVFAASKKQLQNIVAEDEILGNMTIPSADAEYDWNGEQLVFTSYMLNKEWHYECSFYVAVADETGLLYFARYDSSLNTPLSYDEQNYYNRNYMPCEPEELKVSFD